jgi:hypothetical protein
VTLLLLPKLLSALLPEPFSLLPALLLLLSELLSDWVTPSVPPVFASTASEFSLSPEEAYSDSTFAGEPLFPPKVVAPYTSSSNNDISCFQNSMAFEV